MRDQSTKSQTYETLSEFIAQRTSHSVISVTGEDASAYLQGQLTQDIETLNGNQVSLAAHCDFKGKMWSIVQIIPQKQGFYLLTDSSVAEHSLRELKKFGVFSKVNIELLTATTIFAGAGDIMRQYLQQQGHSTTTEDRIVDNQQDTASWYQTDLDMYFLIATQSLKAPDKLQPENHITYREIIAGLPIIDQYSSASYVPQMLNLQALNAICFTKGCYTGQEVVARTKYLGKNKRAMYRLIGTNITAVENGSDVEIQLGENWRRAGTVIRNASVNGATTLLAILPNDTKETDVLRLKTNPECILSLADLPYTLD